MYFALRCQCGSTVGRILGYLTINDAYPHREIFIGPLALECSECHRVIEMMDPQYDGYEAKLGYCYSMRGEGPRSTFKCSKCGTEWMETVVGLEYSLDSSDEIEGDKDRNRKTSAPIKTN
jgi:hypothetical protein